MKEEDSKQVLNIFGVFRSKICRCL